MSEHPHLWHGLQTGLGFYYLLVVLMNFGFAAHCIKKGNNKPMGLVWLAVAGVFFILSAGNFAHLGWDLPPAAKEFVNWLLGPVIYSTLTVVLFVLICVFRKTFTNPQVAWGVLNFSLLGVGLAVTDYNFFANVSRPDNIPIPMLIYSVGFFTWLAMRRAVINDERMDKGEPPLERLDDEKVLVWPDLVYTELIAMILCVFVLIVWAILFQAPLEQPATTARAPNPSKAPWYFLGLQEMLVYFDPWMAGVVLPSMIIVGLIAMPYIDFNQKGNGYYTFSQRPFAMAMFLFGFLVLWVTLIVLGTILRGPNWNFFGPFEYWDTHKVDPLNNVNLSDWFWLDLMGKSPGSLSPLVRELPGLIVTALYLFALPPLLARTFMRSYFVRMGFVRFFLLVTLIQFMASLPIKMVLRWVFNLKYIVAFPEYFFNI